jgi:hypothetical protein
MPGPIDAGYSAREANEMRGGSSNEGCISDIFSIAIIIFTFSITFTGISWLFKKIPTLLNKELLANTFFDIAFSCIVLVIGFGFYQLRERKKLIYATIELGAASGTAFVNFPQLIEKPFQAVLAIMGAIYITVRAFDNFYKWKSEKIK